jgi:exodeoxyribonuclease VII large subunit
MQGVETEQDVPRAIAALAADPAIDAVVLIRGGGIAVRSDLVRQGKDRPGGDACEKPVLTGIGHEIDSSVADLVAHTSRKTPTAVAQFLVERVRAFETGVLEAGRQLGEAARARLTTERTALNDAARDWREGTARSVAGYPGGPGAGPGKFEIRRFGPRGGPGPGTLGRGSRAAGFRPAGLF